MGDASEGKSGDRQRWIRIKDIAARYDIPEQKVRNKLQSGTWPNHRQSGTIRFSPEDQRIIEEKWHRYGGDDPTNRTPSWRELAMKDSPTDEERAAIERGFKYSQQAWWP